MADPLAIYLHDHLAGAALAIDLLEAMQEQYRGEPLGSSATAILVEVKADERVLKQLAETAGEGSDAVKNAARE